ncbi:MAG: WD40/YVTN/BNR-like repeat-containing protein [Chitinophagaceae bacterium]
MKKFFFIVFAICFCVGLFAQNKSSKSIVQEKKAVLDSTILSNVQYRLIGPFRGGRSAAVTGSFKNKNTFYFGATGGGVFKTIDGGSNWKNISDKYFGGSIGAIAAAPSNESIIYVGEGENTMRGNVSEGLQGMWKSTDGGKTWTNIGLKDARHIIRIVIHPTNPDIVLVAAMGHLFGPNNERGVYKTIDGGKSWKQVLFVNNQTGCSDLVQDNDNPNTLYAGMWRVIRTPYSMESGGEGSGLYKSIDGGESWQNISSSKGLPKGTWGIVGVAIAPSNTDKIYTIIENEKGGLYVSNDGGKTFVLSCSDNNIRQRAWYYTKVFVDPKNENVVYCPNVNFMKSVDGGKTFKSIPTPHGDHHDLWIDPENQQRMIVADDGGAQISFDGGANWSTYLNQPTVQVYRVSTDNSFPYRILGGQQDNSAFRIRSKSYNGAITADDFESTAGGESGYVVADPLNPDVTYGGSYMGFLSRYDHKTGEDRLLNVWPDDGIGAGADVQKYRFQWNYPIFFSPHNPKKLYVAGNHLFVSENEGKSWDKISPDLTTNDKSKQLSSGGSITKDNTSVEYYCTIFTATESELEKDILWTGSDDGLINISKDGGKSWLNVTPKNAPPFIMWNCVDVSSFKKGTAYFAGTRYKLDDFAPYIYKTEDYGATWKKIDAGIPAMHFTRAIRADKKREGLLYAGTEYGMYISFDDGQSWQKFQQNLPIVPITDLTIKNNDLIVGTQGRSIYIIDDLSVLQQYNDAINVKNLHAFSPAPAYRMIDVRNFRGPKNNVGANPSLGVVIPVFVKQITDSSKYIVNIYDNKNSLVKTFGKQHETNKLDWNAGMNNFNWDLKYTAAEKIPDGLIVWNGNLDAPIAAPGKYTAVVKLNNDSTTINFTVLAEPQYNATQEDYDNQLAMQLNIGNTFTSVMKHLEKIKALRNQLNQYKTLLGKTMPKNVTHLIDSIVKKVTNVEEALHQTKAKSSQDVLNYPIRLDDKLSGLYNQASTGRGTNNKQVKEVYEVLKALVDIQLNAFDSVLKNEVEGLNKLVHELKLPVFGVGE